MKLLTLGILLLQAPAPSSLSVESSILLDARGVCAEAGVVHTSYSSLTSQVNSLVERTSATFSTLISQGEVEATEFEVFQGVRTEYDEKIKVCERDKQDALTHVETLQAEMKELLEIMRADTLPGPIEWPSISALGARSVAIRSGRTASDEREGFQNMKRAAELHYGLHKAARLASSCARGLGDGGDPCKAEYTRLRLLYKQAYVHIQTLLQTAERLAGDDACFSQANLFLNEKRLHHLQRVREARTQICKAHVDATEAEASAKKLESMVAELRLQISGGCVSPNLKSLFANVETLVELIKSRPSCSGCCDSSTLSELDISGSPSNATAAALTQQAAAARTEEVLRRREAAVRQRFLQDEEVWHGLQATPASH